MDSIERDTILKNLHTYVDMAFSLPETIIWDDALLSRRRIFHIIERGQKEGKTISEMKLLFDRIVEIMSDCDFEISNTNQTDYPGSMMKVKMVKEWQRGVVVVVNPRKDSSKEIITAFTRTLKGIKALQKQNIQESASGETPRSLITGNDPPIDHHSFG